jgi:formylglycine-generating enzyme required for sulfatase activity
MPTLPGLFWPTPGKNTTFIDLFDKLHARNVLSSLGQSFGRLPANASQRSVDQEAFLDQAIAGLAQDGSIVAVQLALFGEMVKGKRWTPATYHEIGGAEGVGVKFLEETFGARADNPQYRRYGDAVKAVLECLIPETGTDIKGHRKSVSELLEVSRDVDPRHDFAELTRVLDKEMRLITPADPEQDLDHTLESPAGDSARYYQLTHDYLVPSLREWLYREKRETAAGRAEITLRQRAADWLGNNKRNRYLPSLGEFVRIRALTRRNRWTLLQRQMMGKATAYHATKWASALALAIIVTVSAILARSWYECAEYCNWLSVQEGISEDQLCYLPNEDGKFADGMRLAPDYLKRTGYRLPAEAEWEYACRAGTRTYWSFGSAMELLPQYARFSENCRNDLGFETTAWVGSLKPNDLGLFDAHGNPAEWCQDRCVMYARPGDSDWSLVHFVGGEVDDIEVSQKTVLEVDYRVLRGGSIRSFAFQVGSAFRDAARASMPHMYVGFRVARTYP